MHVGEYGPQPYADIVRELQLLPMFQGLATEALQSLASTTLVCRYRRNELVLGPGSTEEEGLYIVVEGTARLSRLSSKGHQITLAYLQPGDLFGLVFIEPPAAPRSSVEAMGDGTVMFRIQRHHFRAFIAEHPQVAVYALGLVSRRLAEAYNLIEDLALHDTRARLSRTLARLAAEAPNATLLATHEELALMVGTTRENVTKILRELRAEGLVAFEPHRRGITILRADVLQHEDSD